VFLVGTGFETLRCFGSFLQASLGRGKQNFAMQTKFSSANPGLKEFVFTLA